MQLTFGKVASYYYIDNVIDLKEAISHFKKRIDSTKVVACDTEVRILFV